MTGTALSFRQACADRVRHRVEAADGLTIEALYAAFRSWPRERCLRAVLDLSNAGVVALRFHRGAIVEVHPRRLTEPPA